MAKRVWSIAMVGGLATALLVVGMGRRCDGQGVASDRPAGLIIYPKIVSDPFDIFNQGRSVDTLIQITNTSATADRAIQCFYVDATSHCSNQTNSFDPFFGACRSNVDCDLGGTCDPGWTEVDFPLLLSPGQPVAWLASSGGGVPAGTIPNGNQVPPLAPPVPSSPGYFIGELKCFEVNNSEPGRLPINANDLIGEATTYETSIAAGPSAGSVDVRAYNAIGVPTLLADGSTQNDATLCLGATAGSGTCNTAEYTACPSTLILNHFFDETPPNPAAPGPRAQTDLTLIPCSENFAVQDEQATTTVQFLVFNEFEQRFSTSTQVTCFKETALSNIDARLGQERTSIFNVAVQGTFAGQTRIRPVAGTELNTGHGLLGVAEEFRTLTFVEGPPLFGSSAYNLNYSAVNADHGDFIRYDAEKVAPPPGP